MRIHLTYSVLAYDAWRRIVTKGPIEGTMCTASCTGGVRHARGLSTESLLAPAADITQLLVAHV